MECSCQQYYDLPFLLFLGLPLLVQNPVPQGSRVWQSPQPLEVNLHVVAKLKLKPIVQVKGLQRGDAKETRA